MALIPALIGKATGIGSNWDNLFKSWTGIGGANAPGAGANAMQEYLDWIRQQQADLELSAEQNKLQAEALTNYRRGELADRTGYAGLVNVGDAVKRSDATLAAEMAQLDPTDPERMAYEDAIAAEAEANRINLTYITGEAFKDIPEPTAYDVGTGGGVGATGEIPVIQPAPSEPAPSEPAPIMPGEIDQVAVETAQEEIAASENTVDNTAIVNDAVASMFSYGQTPGWEQEQMIQDAIRAAQGDQTSIGI